MIKIFPTLLFLIALCLGCDNADDSQATAARPAGAPDPPVGQRGEAAQPAAAKAGDTRGHGNEHLAGPEQAFLLQAIRGNDVSLKLAEAAKGKAASDRVKQFARSILDDQQAANQQLRVMASRYNVDLHNQAAGEAEAAAAITILNGADFDSAYLRHELAAIERQLSASRDAAAIIKTPDLLDLVNKTIPNLEARLAAAKELAAPAK